MDYKGLLDTSNAVVVAVAEAMVNMGLDIPLIWTQMANAFQGNAKPMLSQLGLNIDGNDVKSVVESFVTEIKKSGAVQRCNVVSLTDSELVMDIGECIFAPATAIIRGGDMNMIPPCPMMAILYAALNEKTGTHCTVTKCQFRPDLNASDFTVELG
ncbi:MAG: hypothetical protein ACFFE6_03300 [Candidatus Thorarchaeota archaeon]